jgi:hypothetical protein
MEDDPEGVPGLSHCVGNYAGRCVRAESLIVSIRRSEDGAVRRVSTVELEPDRRGDVAIGDLRFTVVQHRAHRNHAPPEAALDALDRLRDLLASGNVPVEPDAFGGRVTELGRGDDAPGEPEIHAAWRTVLPARLAAMSLDDLRAALGSPDAPAAEREGPRP